MTESNHARKGDFTEGGVPLFTNPNHPPFQSQRTTSAPSVHDSTNGKSSQKIDEERQAYNTQVLDAGLNRLAISPDPYEEIKKSDYQASTKTLLLVDHTIREVQKVRQAQPPLAELDREGVAELSRLQEITKQVTDKLVGASKELRELAVLIERLNAGLNGFSSGWALQSVGLSLRVLW